MIGEVRAACRKLNRHPGFTVGAIASLSLGMALAVSVFAVIKSVIWRPLPYEDPERIAYVGETRSAGALGGGYAGAKLALALQSEATAFTQVAAFNAAGASPVSEGVIGTNVGAAQVSPNFFEVLGVRPLMGRVFNSSDALTDGGVIISHAYWTSRLGGERGIVGREVPIYTETDFLWRHRVIGVMPPGVEFPGRTNVWLVLPQSQVERAAATLDVSSNAYRYSAIGRLREGATFREAGVQASALYQREYRADQAKAGRTAEIAPLRLQITATLTESLRLWTAAAIIVALLCAVNFASMTLARGLRRRGEIAVRSVLGARRVDIVRGLVLEAILIAGVAGAVATMFSSWYLTYSGRMLAGRVLPVPPTIDWSAIVFGIGATTAIGFVFALVPAIELAKVDLAAVLQGQTSASTARRGEGIGQRSLAALQLCLAITAVATVTALIQADRKARSLNTYFDYEQVVFANIFRRDSMQRSTAEEILARATRSEGVTGVAMRWREYGALVWKSEGPRSAWSVEVLPATPNLFDVLGVRLVAGRVTTEAESREGSALVASRRFAAQMFGSVDATIGKTVRIKRAGSVQGWARIVGVADRVGGLKEWGVDKDLFELAPPPAKSTAFAALIFRVTGNPESRAQQLGGRGLGERGTVMIRTAADLMQQAIGPTRGRNIFLKSVAALAFLLAIVGVFSVTSYATELRLREFGIRIALGADAPRVARVMFADLWWMAPVGLGVGVIAAGILTSYLDVLYRNPEATGRLVSLTTGPTMAAAGTLLLIAVAGTAMPLRRVLKLDVMRTVQGGGTA